MKMKKLKLLTIFAIALVVSISGCKKDDFVAKVGVCPLVVSTIPADKAIDVPLNQVISATFNEKMNPATITQASFIIQQGTVAVAGTVAYSGVTATFTPSSPLAPNTLYAGTIKTLAKDEVGNALQEDYKWSFTTIPQVTLSSNPVAGGTTGGAGTFAKGSAVTVTATPAVGYVFTNWSENGAIVSTSSPYQFNIAGNRVLVANFSFQFAVVVSSNPAAGGITTGGGSFTAGSSVTVTATPNSGYTFVNWTENLTIASTNASYVFPLNASRTLVANFASSTFTLNVTAVNGTVVKNPNLTAYNSGAIVQLTATPATGYTFTGWTGDATGSLNPVSVTMNANKNITANFTAIVAGTFTLNVTAVNGTVLKVPAKTDYNSGEIVVLTPTPATGYVFTSWSGDATGLLSPLSVTMNSNKNITANFTAIVAGTFTLNVNAVNGTVVKNPDLLSYNSGATVQLTATPNTGYTFTSWSGDATGSITPLTVTMNANKNITANFTAVNPVNPIVDLGTAADFTILTKSGISTTGVSSITGDIGVSPMTATGITGFGLIMDTNGQSSHTPIVTGKVYAANYAPPTPAKMTTAVSDMETAFTTANNLVVPAPIVGLYAGDISGRTLAAGLYKWSTGLLISNAGVTLNGGPNDTWVFQIAQDLTVNNSAIITLTGGAQAKNIFWVVTGKATLGSAVIFSGNILSKTLISLNTGAKATGRMLAQTAVTLNASTVIKP